ncbi:putative NTF2-like domain superfamily, SnoaL-like domain-containing protein [Septoria linicola]|nr:putative NTF2-like domain superfamily, SnoaL-like domain-containing protein [Septoria linicola]
MAYLINISPSSTHEAILDALYRAVNAYDTNDLALHDSAFLDSIDTTFSLDGRDFQGLEAIRGPFKIVGPLDTTHTVTNPRVIHEEGDTPARITATTLAQHFRAGEGKMERKIGFFGWELLRLGCCVRSGKRAVEYQEVRHQDHME